MEDKILQEITDSAKGLKEQDYRHLASCVRKAERIFVVGTGRSGLIGRCFAVRLRHLGIESYIVGETVCPSIKRGDLLVAISSSGKKKTVIDIAETGKKAGAKVVVITSEKNTSLTRLSDHTILIPVKSSVQFGGSLFEQVSLIFLDTFVERFRKQHGISHQDMSKRHTNLE
ncbi:MAG: SIS domain-containing protein [Candidatus Ratteibacteria bacterium]|nr:SIS domain-containing protein [Candidatus Ratteibacteria bacterium]